MGARQVEHEEVTLQRHSAPQALQVEHVPQQQVVVAELLPVIVDAGLAHLLGVGSGYIRGRVRLRVSAG